jgi:hypothetical protein
MHYNRPWCEFAATRYLEHEELGVAPGDRLAKYALTIAKPPGIEQLTRRYADHPDHKAQMATLPGSKRKHTRTMRGRRRSVPRRPRAIGAAACPDC